MIYKFCMLARVLIEHRQVFKRGMELCIEKKLWSYRSHCGYMVERKVRGNV